jgi:aldehyde dehydrogenase (NAD+)
VLSVLTYADEDDAVAVANNSSYRSNGSVFTSDLEHWLDVAARIRTGTVELNGGPAGLSAPMGGVKGSGISRETGPEAIEPLHGPESDRADA